MKTSDNADKRNIDKRATKERRIKKQLTEYVESQKGQINKHPR